MEDRAPSGEQAQRTVADLERQLAEARRELRRKLEEVGLLRLQLDALSTTEPATGLLNRAGVVEAIETALQRLSRLEEPFAVVGVRIPSLAALTALGPAAAREAVRHVGGLIAAALRDLDRIGRLDDTTFAAVASLNAPNAYAAVLDRLRTVLTYGPVTIDRGTFVLDPQFSVVLAGPSARGEPTSIHELTEDLLGRATEGATRLVRL